MWGKLAHLFFCILLLQQLSAQKLPSVYLNHAYTVLDSTTYAAIQNSTFLKGQFAHYKERTSVSNGGKTWSGAYLYGEKTYIEFFPAGKFPQFKSNESGIGFGVEDKDGVNFYYKRLKETFGDQAETSLVTRFVNGSDIPWFYDAGINYRDDEQTFYDWLMEYEPTYLQQIYTDLKAEEGGISRKQYLSRDFKNDRLFKNVIEVTIALDKKETERLIKELEVFNYKISKKGNKLIVEGPEVKFFIINNSSANGITSLKMELTRKIKGRRVYKFGAKSVLRLKGDVAYWTF